MGVSLSELLSGEFLRGLGVGVAPKVKKDEQTVSPPPSWSFGESRAVDTRVGVPPLSEEAKELGKQMEKRERDNIQRMLRESLLAGVAQEDETVEDYMANIKKSE